MAKRLYSWYKLRWEVLERDNFTCQYCGKTAPDVMLQVDHKTALADGGTDNLDNLVTSCASCNHGKGTLHQSIMLAKARESAKVKRHIYGDTQTERLLTFLQDGAKPVKSIISHLEVGENRGRSLLSKLKKRHLITNISNGMWGLLCQP